MCLRGTSKVIDANEVKASFCYLANLFVNPYEPTKNNLTEM